MRGLQTVKVNTIVRFMQSYVIIKLWGDILM